MPLGKLSRKQLMSGYNVLTSLLDILTDDKDSKLQQSLIIDATNRLKCELRVYYNFMSRP